MDFEQPISQTARKEAFEGALLTLKLQDRAGLLARFINPEREAPVEQLLVVIDRPPRAFDVKSPVFSAALQY